MDVGFIPAGPLAAPPASKVIRPPGLKRGKTEEAISDRIKLETVLGLTVTSNAALDSDPNSELVAYPAGCTVVLYNTRKNRQSHILNASRKTITCVAFSGCGRYLATGECGHAPCVRIWDLQEQGGAGGGGSQLAEFPSHKYGVNCVSFSVNSKYLVSVGSQHDMIVNVWEWRAGLKLASNKVSSKVKAVSFAESGGYFVTVGNRHVKFWYLEYSRGAKYKEPVPLMGRSAILGEQRNNDFCDVACGRGECADSTYAITRSGLLCEFNNRRLLDKWVELRTPSANCMSLGTNFIFVGCADGIVRCFSPSTLQFVTTLPRTHYLGVDVSQGLNISHMFSHPANAKYPDAIALTYDEKHQRLTCVYNDHSLYVWDVRDIKRVGKSHSSLYHSACIWGVEVPPEVNNDGVSEPPTPPLPPGSFLTCSSDDTVRVWTLSQNGKHSANIYSDELQRVLYMDPELTFLRDVDLSSAGEKDKPVSYDGKNGVRCIRVSCDGIHLASGDRAGNVRIHDLNKMREICRLEAHNAEVLCLEYCSGNGKRLLASASRDRLIHVFHVDEDYNFMQTLDDHSSSITAVRFLTSENSLQMVSCGADKTILFRSLVESPNGGPGQFVRGHNCSARSTLYDMEVDAGGRHVLAACQDRAVRVYNTRSGRHTKTFRASLGDEGSLIKVVLDRSGIYVATSCTNKSLSVYDYYSGECMATMYGHSELVTGLRFTADCQHLISASGDGCIFVWKVPHDMVVTMRARLAQQAIRQGRRPPSSNGVPLDSESDRAGSPLLVGPSIAEDPLVLATRDTPSKVAIPPLDLGRLPPWAQKTIGGETASLNAPSPPQAVVRGKWAMRAEKNDYRADYYMEPERPMESDGSKDSSLDSGTDTRIYSEPKQDMVDINNKQLRFNDRRRLERPKSLNLSMLNDMHRPFEPKLILRSPYSPFRSSPKAGILRNFSFPEETELYYPWLDPKQFETVPAERDYNENVSSVTKMSRRLDRVRHHTDDSSLGSFKYEDHESTEHDGDVEDISDGERTSSSDHNTQASDRIIYYPDNNDDNTLSEYTVNAMDVEELRQSQRKIKKPTLPIPLVTVSATSVSGSGQDSDEDEDEVSTPSGDNGDRNPLSGSCESLERLNQRTSFLKSAFESLSGAEMDSNNAGGNTSISSQHHKSVPHTTLPTPVKTPSSGRNSSSGTGISLGGNNPGSARAPVVPPRNAALINAAKQSLNDPSALNRRQELTRRIEETKKQLESVGYRSKLKASQSTMDLSYRNGDRETDSRPPTSRQRPLSQNISSGNTRGYSSENHPTNTLQASTNNNKHCKNLAYRSENVGPTNTNQNPETFYDSLTTDVNKNRQILTNYKSPYDIPANLNHRHYGLKLDDLNCTASEFIKKRHEQFEKNHKDKAGRFITNYQSEFCNRNVDEQCNNNLNKDSQYIPKVNRGYAFTVDFGHTNSQDEDKKTGKVFDRLFPNANKSVTTRAVPPSRNFTLNLNPSFDNHNNLKVPERGQMGNKSHKSRSILKNYKSCPVSPVSEECKWGDTTQVIENDSQNDRSIKDSTFPRSQTVKDVRKRNSMSYFMDFDTNTHLMKDNGKSLVDTIKSDTEKMIAEITKKYGDLDDYEPSSGASDYKVDDKTFDKFGKKQDMKQIITDLPAEDLKEKDDGNFSSDSLEDCSLSQDAGNKNKVFTKKVCKKHPLTAIARRCVSDYEIYGGLDESNANYISQNATFATTQVSYHAERQQKSFTLPKNMPSNLDEYSDAHYSSVSQEQLNNNRNNNMQRCYSALTKRCVTRSNESVLSDENSNCSSVSNEIFMKYGDQNAFAQRKISEKQFLDNSQNCSFENLCYETEAAYLEKHRHSSASFFLNQRQLMKASGSQESILSDDLLQSDSDNQMSKTNCNSLESILSDDSEYTKSAPLEMLFEHRKHIRKPEIASGNPSGIYIPKTSQSCYEFDNSSKSYGSSPNNNTTLGTYMYYNSFRHGEGIAFGNRNIVASVRGNTNITSGFDIKQEQEPTTHKTVTRSVSLQDSSVNSPNQRRNIAYYFDGKEIKEYAQTVEKKRTDEIPSMKSKNEEYKNNQRKSLSTDCEEKYKYVCSVEGMENNCVSKSKSCSFEVLMEPATSVKPMPKRITEKSHVQKNLEKFESQIRKHAQAKMEKSQNNKQSNNCHHKPTGKAIATKSLERNSGLGSKNINGKQVIDFVPHKPPKPVKRTSSVKLTNRNRIKSGAEKYPNLDSGLGATVRAKIDGLQLKNSNAFVSKAMYSDGKHNNSNDEKILNNCEGEEKSFDVYVTEKEVLDNKSEIQMDSLEYVSSQKRSDRASDFSLDSLDNVLDERTHDNFAKDSLNYDSFTDSPKFDANSSNLAANNHPKNSVSNKNMPFLKISPKDGEVPSGSDAPPVEFSDRTENIDFSSVVRPEDINMYKDIERKIVIINKLVELEEKKILHEKYLKECRMRPLKANFSDGKGTVKILSRNFEKLASKHQTKGTLDASDFFSLTYDDFESDKEENSVKSVIKRNLSLPDVLDAENIELVSSFEEKCVGNESGNLQSAEKTICKDNEHCEKPDFCGQLEGDSRKTAEVLNNAADNKMDGSKCLDKTKDLKQRVYNITVIPKTDIHIDSENYESSTTSSSCTNSPKRLFFASKYCDAKPKTSKISSLFRNKFDRGRITSGFHIKTVSESNTSNVAPPVLHVKPIIGEAFGKNVGTPTSNSGLARKLSLQQPLLLSKHGTGQGTRNRLAPNDFNSLIDDESSGLRRAISLSDLAFKPSPSPRTSLVSGKTSQGGSNSKLSGSRGQTGRHSKQFSSNMTRSSSVGVLNQSDSESEAGHGVNGRTTSSSRIGGLMRPTISSQNKVAPAAARRRGVQAAYSSVNLSTVGQEDSSSEEAGADGRVSGSSSKPAVPPRPPRIAVDGDRRNVGRSGSERDLSSKAREVTHRLTAPPSRKHSAPSININAPLDPNTGQVTPMACQQLAQQLTRLTAKIVHMYSALSDSPRETSHMEKFSDNADMLHGLESAMVEAQKMLSQATGRIRMNGNGSDQPISLTSSLEEENGNSHVSLPINTMSRTLDELVSRALPATNGEINQGQAMCVMDKYSDLLYDMVNKFGSNNGQTYQDGS